MAVDFLAKRDILEQIIPSDAANSAVTSGVSGAWSAYVQVIAAASLTYPFILCGAYVYSYFSIVVADGTQIGMLNLQVATGAAGAEVPIAEGHSGLLLVPGTTATDAVQGITGRTLFFEPILIPATTRISIRASASSAKTLYNGVYLFGYDASYFANPIKYIKELRYIRGLCSPTQGSQVFPSPGTTNVTTHATTSYTAYGTPVQFIASATSPLLITGAFGKGSPSSRCQVKIGVGAAGSEVWMSKLAMPIWSVAGVSLSDSYLPRPLYVKKGEAVSVAIAGVAGSTVGIALKGFYLK